MATSKGNTVKDIHGDVLKLEAGRLIEENTGKSGCCNWAAKYSDIRAAVTGRYPWRDNGILIRRCVLRSGRNVYDDGITIVTNFEMPTGVTRLGRIGCRQFSAHNFRKILKAAGVQSVRKAKAARAGA